MSGDISPSNDTSATPSLNSLSSDPYPSRGQCPDQLFLSGHTDPLISVRVQSSYHPPRYIRTMTHQQQVSSSHPSGSHTSSKPRPDRLESSLLKQSELTDIKETDIKERLGHPPDFIIRLRVQKNVQSTYDFL